MGHQRNVKKRRKQDRAMVKPFIELTEEERLLFMRAAPPEVRRVLVSALKRLGYNIYVRRRTGVA